MYTSIKYLALLVVVSFVGELALFWYNETHVPNLPFIDQSERTLGTGTPIRYIAAGDSTAVGRGASSYEETYAYGIAKSLGKVNAVEYKNIAVVGAKTGDVLKKQIDQIIAYKPDVVTISIGANDETHLTSNNKIYNNYVTIINTLQEKTTAKIYITNIPNFHGATILPWWYIQILELRSKSLNPKLLALENSRVKIINIHNFGWSQFSDMSKTYAADHFHPNDIGYNNWKNAFLDKIQK